MAAPKQRLGFWYRVVAHFLRPILMVTTRRAWSGTEHLPPAGVGVVVTPNHISYTDPLTLAHLGKIITACGQIPVYRASRDAARAYRDAVSAVRAGECVGIYPEGTITKDPDLWPMIGKTGAARVALETGCPVIPIAQWGPQEILAPYSKRLRLLPPKTVHVLAGPGVDLTDLRGRPVTAEVLRAASDRIVDAITAQLGELRSELPPLTRYDPARPDPAIDTAIETEGDG